LSVQLEHFSAASSVIVNALVIHLLLTSISHGQLRVTLERVSMHWPTDTCAVECINLFAYCRRWKLKQKTDSRENHVHLL